MLTQEQTPPPPKAVNIIRPSSPLFHYLKQRPSSPYHHHKQQQLHQQQQQQRLQQQQEQQQHVTSNIPIHHSSGTSHSTSTMSSSSSPSTISTLSGGSGTYNMNNNNRLPPPPAPTILNSSSFGFNFFQAPQNSTPAPPTAWFKSTSPIPSHPPTTTPPQPSSTGFMNPFAPRFFRVRQSSVDDNNFFLRRQPSVSDIQEHREGESSGDEEENYDSIDGDTEEENEDEEEEKDTDIDLELDSDMESDDTQNDDDEDDDEDDNPLSDEDNYTDDDVPIKVVARVKNGTIMNGKGELVSKGNDDRASHSSWLDEARVGRKIADLEIEKSSLLALNSTLETKVRQQAAKIAKLEKQLQMNSNEWPLSPVSDKDMDEEQPCFEKLLSTDVLTEDEIANDHVFQKLRRMLLGLIEQAEEAVRLQTKSTGRVLIQYSNEEKIITLDSPPTLLKPSTRITPFHHQQQQQQQQGPAQRRQIQSPTAQQKRPLRRVSDAQDNRRSVLDQHHHLQQQQQQPTRKRTPMERSLSRASSPAVLVSTENIPHHHSNEISASPQTMRPTSPRQMQRSSTRPRSSHLRKSQDLENPKWHY